MIYSERRADDLLTDLRNRSVSLRLNFVMIDFTSVIAFDRCLLAPIEF